MARCGKGVLGGGAGLVLGSSCLRAWARCWLREDELDRGGLFLRLGTASSPFHSSTVGPRDRMGFGLGLGRRESRAVFWPATRVPSEVLLDWVLAVQKVALYRSRWLVGIEAPRSGDRSDRDMLGADNSHGTLRTGLAREMAAKRISVVTRSTHDFRLCVGALR